MKKLTGVQMKRITIACLITAIVISVLHWIIF